MQLSPKQRRIDFSTDQMADYLNRNGLEKQKKKINALIKQGAVNNRIYSINEIDRAIGFIPTFYTKPLIYAKQQYFCPNGWRRYGLDVGLSRQQFANRYEDWPVCYHGTSWRAAREIILNGFQAQNNSACFISKDQKAVFLTPSIVYAGHPRYAKIQKYQGMYIQVALQVRVRNLNIKRMPGTVQNTFVDCETPVDPNYKDNHKLQWVFVWNKDTNIRPCDGLLIYGLMARIVYDNPRFLPQNHWWEQSRERLKWDAYQKK